MFMLFGAWVHAQEETPVAAIQIPSQNLLKFNRFLINPTFSTVNEDKSYLNFYHRNQWAAYENNYNTYLASYSGRIGDRMGVGLSVYHQNFATISNFGLMANYAYGVKLAEKSNLTFGFNLSYYNSGIDDSNLNTAQPDDPLLVGLDGSSMVSFQPGINLSLGSFDLGVYAENLFDYNLRTNESLTSFGEKTYTGHLMYTRKFQNGSGMFENGKFSVLSRARNIAGDDLNLSGSLILDLPKLGWLETGYDDFYGVAAGLGFNLTDRISIGYTAEKGIDDQISNFGVTHEVHFAYSFTPTLTENRVYEDFSEENQMVYSEEAQDSIKDKNAEIARLRELVEENNMIIEEMMFRQDSMEEARQKYINKRFAYMQKFIKDYANKENQGQMNAQLQQFKKDIEEGVAFREPSIDTDKYKKNEAAKPEPVSYASQNTLAAADIPVKETADKAVKRSVTDRDTQSEAAAPKRGNTSLQATTTQRVDGAGKGYYLIANVFRKESNLNRFLKELEEKGIKASSFKKNGLNYVYLERFEKLADARVAYESNLDGVYQGKSWVLRIKQDSDMPERNRTETRLAKAELPELLSDKNGIASADQKNKDYKSFINRQRAVISECTERYVNNLMKPFLKPEEREVLFAENREVTPRKTDDLKGYYIVANVYKNEQYARRFVESLKKKGIEANIYINPRNNYKYVYLQKYNSWRQAVGSYRSNVNYTYEDDIWIMPVGSS
ncbi:PorP/SprF family type IX secretion system membrane protein [Robertkochia flava]|uniref:PorP/SprF family type IX secretion system membrane protein n=1 Tax=Robertkochia flava TaxID=3447986 RepID=UPI0021D431CF|nr:type IX secretion system membrane protein PorP/SprF [Robertkochia marina]